MFPEIIPELIGIVLPLVVVFDLAHSAECPEELLAKPLRCLSTVELHDRSAHVWSKIYRPVLPFLDSERPDCSGAARQNGSFDDVVYVSPILGDLECPGIQDIPTGILRSVGGLGPPEPGGIRILTRLFHGRVVVTAGLVAHKLHKVLIVRSLLSGGLLRRLNWHFASFLSSDTASSKAAD